MHRVLPNDRYVIRDIENNQVTQKPYDGIIESSHMRRWADCRSMELVEDGEFNEQHSTTEDGQIGLNFDE